MKKYGANFNSSFAREQREKKLGGMAKSWSNTILQADFDERTRRFLQLPGYSFIPRDRYDKGDSTKTFLEIILMSSIGKFLKKNCFCVWRPFYIKKSDLCKEDWNTCCMEENYQEFVSMCREVIIKTDNSLVLSFSENYPGNTPFFLEFYTRCDFPDIVTLLGCRPAK